MMKNTPKITVDFLIGMKSEALHSFIHQNYAGTDNRFRRQELIKELTGLSIPLVKCGISHLIEKIEGIRKEKAKAKIERLAIKVELDPQNIEVGTPVIRKKCGRKGVIKANVNGKLDIAYKKSDGDRYEKMSKLIELYQRLRI